MAVNKVVYDGKTLIDLSGDSVTPAMLAAGYTAHAASGEEIVGVLQVTSKEEIVQEVITALGTPVFGRVDADNNIILTGELVAGTYTYMYESEDGSRTLIGTTEHGGGTEPTPVPTTYTNVIPLSTDVNGQPYNGGLGYRTGYRYSNGSGGDVEYDICSTTGYIKVNENDVLRFKNVGMSEHAGDTNACIMYYFVGELKAKSDGSNDAANMTSYNAAQWDVSGNISQLTMDMTGYVRFNTAYLGNDSVITINEEITGTQLDSEVTYTNWIPLSTDVDGVTPYNGGQGCKTRTRYSASGGGDIKAVFVTTSGYIPVSYGDIIRLKNIRMNYTDENVGTTNTCNLCIFTELGTGQAINSATLTSDWNAEWDADGNLIQFKITNNTTCYIRLNASYIGSASILTINEEIDDSGKTKNEIIHDWLAGVKLNTEDGTEETVETDYNLVSTVYNASRHLPIERNTTYKIFKGSDSYTTVYVFVYDAEGNFLKSIRSSDFEYNANGEAHLTVPPQGATFRVRLGYGIDQWSPFERVSRCYLIIKTTTE